MRYFKSLSTHYIFVILLFTTIAFSCSQDDDVPADDDEELELEEVDYVAGVGVGAAGGTIATVWRAGVPTPLLATHPGAAVHNSAAYGMDVVGKDVYVCGVIYTTVGNLPIYWKNGAASLLTPGNGQATAILVDGNDVYVTGQISDPNGSGYSYGAVWKNGDIDYLSEGTIYSSASAVAISGSDVYVGGNIHEDGKTYAAYWKNGNPVLLSSGAHWANVSSLAIIGADVYAAGNELGDETAKYWKNGQPVSLGDGSINASISNVYFDGTDVYFAGTRRNGDTIDVIVWKNNTVVTTTPMSVYDIQISGILSKQNEIVLAGNVVLENTNPVTADATIWTNGASSVLERGSDGVNVLFATSIDRGN